MGQELAVPAGFSLGLPSEPNTAASPSQRLPLTVNWLVTGTDF